MERRRGRGRPHLSQAANLLARLEHRSTEAYVRLLKLDSSGAVSYLRAFLFKTAANIAIDRLRTRGYRERPAPLTFFESVPDGATPERAADGTQQLALLAKLLDELPVKCRRALILNRYYGMDVTAIAKDL